jgi:hypothetical protein
MVKTMVTVFPAEQIIIQATVIIMGPPPTIMIVHINIVAITSTGEITTINTYRAHMFMVIIHLIHTNTVTKFVRHIPITLGIVTGEAITRGSLMVLKPVTVKEVAV